MSSDEEFEEEGVFWFQGKGSGRGKSKGAKNQAKGQGKGLSKAQPKKGKPKGSGKKGPEGHKGPSKGELLRMLEEFTEQERSQSDKGGKRVGSGKSGEVDKGGKNARDQPKSKGQPKGKSSDKDGKGAEHVTHVDGESDEGGKGVKGGKGVAASSKGASELRCRGCNIILRLGHLHQPTCPLGRGEPVQENESMGWNAQVISDTPGAAPGGEGSHGFWHSVELEDFEGRLKEAGLSINDVEVIKDNSWELVDLLHELGYKDAVQRLKVLRALRAHFGDSSATGAG